jgi:hypothetical protein
MSDKVGIEENKKEEVAEEAIETVKSQMITKDS